MEEQNMNTIENNTVNTTETTTKSPTFGFKWHNFLIYFSLWIGAFLNALFGLACLLEGEFLFGILSVGIAAYTIFARFQLANFKVNAYNHLLASQLIVVAVNLITIGFDITTVLSSLAGSLLTYYYYRKREELFVN